MSASTFMEDEKTVPDMATGYYVKNKRVVPSPSFGGWAGGAGAIVSTASDLAKWDDAFFSGRLISDADVRLMTSAGRLANGQSTGYGFGWIIDTHDGQKRRWHNGGTFGFGATNEIYPGYRQRIIVLENNADASPEALADDVLLALHPQLAALENRPAAGEDRAVTKRAQKTWNEFQNGPLDRSEFTTKMNEALTPQIVAGAKAQFAQLGAPTKWVYRGTKTGAGETTYTYRVTFSSGVTLNIYMSVADGKISGYLASPN